MIYISVDKHKHTVRHDSYEIHNEIRPRYTTRYVRDAGHTWKDASCLLIHEEDDFGPKRANLLGIPHNTGDIHDIPNDCGNLHIGRTRDLLWRFCWLFGLPLEVPLGLVDLVVQLRAGAPQVGLLELLLCWVLVWRVFSSTASGRRFGRQHVVVFFWNLNFPISSREKFK